MAKRLNYTQMTLRYLRSQGVVAEVVERWNPYAGQFGKRKDLFGFIDIIALDPVHGIVAIQSTSGPCHSQHRKKILEEKTQETIEWLSCGGKLWLISWKKKKLLRGGKAERWCMRKEEITQAQFSG